LLSNCFIIEIFFVLFWPFSDSYRLFQDLRNVFQVARCNSEQLNCRLLFIMFGSRKTSSYRELQIYFWMSALMAHFCHWCCTWY